MSKSALAGVWPLSPLQEGILFHSLYDEQGMDVYVEQMVFGLDGDLNPAVLRAAWQAVLDRHENLRACFPRRGSGSPVQLIMRRVVMPWREEDLSDLDAAAAEAEAERIALAEHTRFDLSVPPLLKVLLLKFAPDRYRMVVTLHHILMDGWSLQILTRELGMAYGAGGTTAGMPPAVPYRDYLAWLAGQDLDAARQAWREALDGAEEPTMVAPRDHGATQTFPGVVSAETGTDLDAELKALARNAGVTVNTIAQAAWAVVVGRLTGRRDIVFGASVAGRPPDLAGMETMLGLFINTVPVRVRFEPGQTVTQLLAGLQAQQTALLDHHYLSLTEIQRAGGPGAVFDTIMAFENFGSGAESAGPGGDAPPPSEEEDPGRVRFTPADIREATNFPLSLMISPVGGLRMRLSYRPDIFAETSAQAMLDLLMRVLATFAAAPGTRVADIGTILPAERALVVDTWNDTAVPVAPGTMLDLFGTHAAKSPEAPALRCGASVLTYAEVDARSSSWAAHLASRGAGPETRVGLLLPRGVDMIVAMLAVWKAGAAFVPLDPAYPSSRLDFIVADSGAAMVVDAVPDLEPMSAPIVEIDPDSLAYVIYTSGSAGTPKGVAVAHRGAVNLAEVMRPVLGVEPGTTMLQFASFSFDASILDVVATLGAGGTLAIASEAERKDPAALTEMIRATGVEVASVVPSLMTVLDPASVPGVRSWLVGAERVSAELASRWAGRTRVRVGYGPTEATVIASTGAVEASLVAEGVAPPIGVPVGNTRIYLLDEFLRPVAPGVPGELYIAGVQLARGYVGRSGQTSAAFVACPFGVGERMYRSGDLARWDDGGNLRFEGRADHQVKIRGFRVEPGEIESVLLAAEGVSQAAVIVREERLVAYVVGATDSLREFAAARLPEHMVPATFVRLDTLPLTVNGKLDRAALPAPEIAGSTGRAPATPVEELLCGLYAEILGLDRAPTDVSFFDLGGDSLTAMRLVARIRAVFDTEVGIGALFTAPTVAEVARLVEGDGGNVRPPLTPRPRVANLPLSYAQQRLWFLNRLEETDEGAAAAYNMPLTLRLSGDLDIAALEAALGDVADRHESLRTVFAQDEDGTARQQIREGTAGRPPLPVIHTDEDALPELLAEHTTRGFDLATDLPWRAWLLIPAPGEHVLLLVAHHIAVDGWSMGLLSRDLQIAYTARVRGAAPDQPPLPVQYADYALWQRAVLGDLSDPDSVISGQLAHWRRALGGVPPELRLPTDRPRPAVPSFRGETVPFEIDAATHVGLLRIAQQGRVTMFMVVHAALSILLSRVGAGTDIPMGTAIAGRGDAALDELVGFFINTLVLRADLSGDPSFAELLAQVRESDLAAYAHQDVPFERLVDELAPERSLSRNPLFQVMFSLQNVPQQEGGWELPGVQVSPFQLQTGSPARFDLSIDLMERRDPKGDPAGLIGGILYATDLFDEPTIRALTGRLARVLAQIAADPQVRVGDIEVLDPAERTRVLQTWNDTAARVPDGTLPDLFAARAARIPDAVAVRCGAESLTYAELDTRSDAWAAYLLGLGAGPEVRVALLLPRGVDMIVAMLAVWKAGAAFVPLDPEYPAARLEYIVADSGASLVVGTAEPMGDARPVPWSDIESASAPAVAVHPDSLAYLIYTSGSTGLPKGVAVAHRGLANLAESMRPVLGGGEGVVTLQFASFSFDASILDVAVTLSAGGTLAIASASERRDPELLSAMIRDSGAEVASTVPSLLSVLDPEAVPGVRNWVLGAERLTADLANRWRTVWNTYGPTEATVITTAVPLPPVSAAAPPIGAPIGNMRVYVLDDYLRPAAPGVIGELYIAGVQLARGYVGRSGLTAGAFVACPFEAGERMYRSGDLARWDDAGRLHFEGRADQQVKIRGFRVEPGEVEAVLAACDDVSQAAVIVRDGRLIAYVVSAAGTETLRSFVAQRLPDYMIPSAFVTVDALPLTVNGKLDRSALPAPELAGALGRAPETPVEELFCRLYADVLSLETVGAEASFFDLGGDSIMSMLLVSKARRAGLVITARQVFERKTPAGLALVAEAADDSAPAGEPGVGELPLTPVMRELLDRTGPGRVGEASLATMITTPAGARPDALDGALRALLAHHDLLRARLDDDRLIVPGPESIVPGPESIAEGEWLHRVDVAGIDGEDVHRLLDEQARAAADRIDPRAGVMVQAVWFDAGPERAGRLLLMIAHLVVDTVSLRILLPDLAEAYAAVSAGREAELQPVPTSFRHWALGLATEATGAQRTSELDDWRAILGDDDPLLTARAVDHTRDTVGGTRRVSAVVPAEVTEALLTAVPAAWHAGIDDVLLTGLAAAVAEWRGGAPGGVLFDVEGHGRGGDADLSRTVGWFTSSHPVRLDPGALSLAEVRDGGAAAGQAIKRVKEQLRGVPSDGLGFGLLRYLNPETGPRLSEPRAQIGYNYLGRFPGGGEAPEDGDAPREEPPWQIAGQGVGGTDRNVPVLHPLEVSGVVHDQAGGPQLTLTLAWPGELLDEAAAQRLLDGWAAMLTGLAGHTARGGGGHTPSDFPLAEITQGEIERYETETGPGLAEIWPLSPLQEGILFHSLYDEQGMDVYAEQMVFGIDGDLDTEALRAAWQWVIDRHESLRAGFRTRSDGSPLQIVRSGVVVPWRAEDLTGVSDPDAEADRLALEEHTVRFDLAAPPLLKVLLLTFAPDRYRMVVTLHHILLDGWSIQVLVQELGAAYGAATGDAAVGEAPPAISYREYLGWLARQDADAARDAWRRALAGAEDPTLVAPLDHGAVQSFPGSVAAETGPELDTALRDLARDHGLTVNTVVQAAWAAVLGGLTGRRDVVFGASVAGRPAELPGMETMLGLFINTVPVRVRFDPSHTVAEMLTELQSRQTALMDHQYLSLSEIQRLAGPGALFDTIMAFESFGSGADSAGPAPDQPAHAPGAVRITPEQGREAINYPLGLVVGPADGLSMRLNYRADLFDEVRARSILDRLLAVLARMAAEPSLPVTELAPLDPADRDLVVRAWNDTAFPVPGGTVLDLIAGRNPDAVAVRGGDQLLSYRQLDARSSSWAAHLTARGVGPETVVALRLPRGVDMVVAMVAVWKAGAAFVPLDPAYPSSRLDLIVADSGAVLVVDSVPDLVPVAAPVVSVDPDSLAYVIYTSGSTGVPKGVAVAHRGVVNLAESMRPVLGAGEGVVTLQFASFSFDASILDVVATLSAGGTLAIATEAERTDPAALSAMVRDTGVKVVSTVPSLLSVLEPAQVPGIRNWVLGAERLTAELANRFSGDAKIWNTYGPTEATVITTAVPLPAFSEAAPPIGAPIGNTRVYVLDEFLTPVAPGVPGELYLAGPGLARGYIGQPGMTAGRFVACPFTTGQRMYRSGDLARWDDTGQLHFEGRADQQVKIRGFRVEPGEVEAVLTAHPGVNQAAVVQRDSRLVAYVVGSVPASDTLREYVAERLPEHMVPSAVVPLDALPLTVNGKLNRAALPAPDTGGRAPATPVEELLCGLFAEVLGVPEVPADRSFFDLGGESLLAMRLVARIRAVFDTDVSLRTLFAQPTVAGIARTLDGGDRAEGLLLPLRTGGSRPPLFCVHPSLGLASCYADLARQLADRPVYGLQARGFTDGEHIPGSIEEMAEDYVAQIRTVQPEGPYHLLGWSFGGLVAHAMATHLRRLGETVELLAVVDGYPVAARRDVGPERREPAAGSAPRMPEDMMRVNASHIAMSDHFTPDEFDGDLLLFVATEQHSESSLIENAADSWTPYVRGTIERVDVAAAHHTMLLGGAVTRIGKTIFTRGR